MGWYSRDLDVYQFWEQSNKDKSTNETWEKPRLLWHLARDRLFGWLSSVTVLTAAGQYQWDWQGGNNLIRSKIFSTFHRNIFDSFRAISYYICYGQTNRAYKNREPWNIPTSNLQYFSSFIVCGTYRVSHKIVWIQLIDNILCWAIQINCNVSPRDAPIIIY